MKEKPQPGMEKLPEGTGKRAGKNLNYLRSIGITINPHKWTNLRNGKIYLIELLKVIVCRDKLEDRKDTSCRKARNGCLEGTR